MKMLMICLLAVLLAAPVGAEDGRDPESPELWFFVSTNLLREESVEEVETLVARGAAAGYTRLMVIDTMAAVLDRMPRRYFDNIGRVKAAAAEHGVQVVPGLLKIGWSNSILSHDPNLAEAMPVRDALFVVDGDEARHEPDPPVMLRGGDMQDLSLWDWRDEMVQMEDGAAKMSDPAGRNARLVQTVGVRPHRQYRISVRVRGDAFEGSARVVVLGGGRTLAQTDFGRPGDAWRRHHVVFNSLEHEEVTVYLGSWNGRRGVLWWDEASLEEVGLLNVVRRDSSPVTVRVEDGGVLVENEDYERIVDERLGQERYAAGHEPPAIRLLRPLAEGTRLRVSYEHAMTVQDGQAMICPSEPATVELMRDQAKRVHEAWGATDYFLYYDEVRILNHDHACRSRGLTPGEILADNVRTAIDIMREVNPGGGLYIWSDMFDPHHNAHANYFLVNGDLAGSWKGLDADVTIAVWNFGQREQSLSWFAGRGHQLVIAGYYDHPVELVSKWLDAAAPHAGVVGVMYTTWRGRYDDLEGFAEMVRAWEREEEWEAEREHLR